MEFSEMHESEFINEKVWMAEKPSGARFKSRLDRAQIENLQLIYWREHCLECSPPECYHSCQLYAARVDKRCLRFDYGIFRNPHFSGIQDFGADIRFRPWAKLETDLYGCSLTPRVHNKLGEVDEFLAWLVNGLSKITGMFRPWEWLNKRPYNPQRKIYKAFAFLRNRGLSALEIFGSNACCDVLVIECYSLEKEPYNLIVEYREERIKGRAALKIMPGPNYYEIPTTEIGGGPSALIGQLSVYPENDATVRGVFTWLDVVKKKCQAVKTNIAKAREFSVPAEKAKCVAWDLDGTVWEGVLIEIGKDNIKLRPEVVETIKELDKRGIIQTIVSKNDFESAWAILTQYGLQEYFIYPAINWSPKSANIKEIARRINIGIDTIVLVDDSPFERAEVSETLPGVRVYSENDIARLPEFPEFDLPVTETSRIRRQTYLQEMEREKIREAFGSDYESFLRSCRMELRIFVPKEQAHKKRCFELLQRSNQLNLSSKRYTEFEFEELMSNDEVLCLALDCSDRFGIYGIVGFASVDESLEEPRLVDFAISCRVAQKMVEHAFFQWIAARQARKGRKVLMVKLNKTNKNSPLVDVFKKLPFEIVDENDTNILMQLRVEKMAAYETIVRVTAEAE